MVAPTGTTVVMELALHELTLAVVPLKVTDDVLCAEPKPVPEIVTELPINPDPGVRLLILGTTVKATELLASPPTIRTTLPVVAALGTETVMLVLLQLLTVAAVPLKSTVLEPWAGPKPAPVMVTDVPTMPELGLRLVMLGEIPPKTKGFMVTATALNVVVDVKLAVCAVPAALVVILYSVSPPFPSMAPKLYPEPSAVTEIEGAQAAHTASFALPVITFTEQLLLVEFALFEPPTHDPVQSNVVFPPVASTPANSSPISRKKLQ